MLFGKILNVNKMIKVSVGSDSAEFLLIFIMIGSMLFSSLKRKKIGYVRYPSLVDCWGFGKQMNTLLKGIACIMIIMSHYVTMYYGTIHAHGVVYYTQIYSANIALVWFMYSSGYGLALKNNSGGQYLSVAVKRIAKVYLPLIFVCFSSMILKKLICIDGSWSFSYLLGMKDEWYVWCIIYFYGIYYLAQYLSNKIQIDITIILSILLIGYFAFAYLFFGESQAHYYRFPLAFIAGHVVGKKGKMWKSTLLICVFMMTFFFMEFHFFKCYILAFAFIFILSVFDKFYDVKEGSLYRIGLVSYFFYLCHQRISEQVLDAIGVQDCLLWIVTTFFFAYLLNTVYNKFIYNSIFR